MDGLRAKKEISTLSLLQVSGLIAFPSALEPSRSRRSQLGSTTRTLRSARSINVRH